MATRTFEGAHLDDVLVEVQDALGPTAAIVRADRRRSGGVLGFFAKERFVVEVDVPDDEPPTRRLDVPALAPAPRSLLDLVDAVGDADRATIASRPVTAPVSSAPSTERPAFADVLSRLTREQARPPAPAAVPAPGPSGEVPEMSLSAGVLAGRRSTVRNERRAETLARLGLPELLVPSGTDDRALVDRLALLPEVRPLPRGAGAVIALVGERNAGLALAADLAAELVLNPENILVATSARGLASIPAERRIGSVAAAAALRPALAGVGGPTIVVVDAPTHRAGAAWAAHLLAALEPTVVWGVVDAFRKPEDLRAWAERVGGLDALAVLGVDETESPAAVLRVGIPVARLDGTPASPLRWASLLADRLAAAAGDAEPVAAPVGPAPTAAPTTTAVPRVVGSMVG
jgi:hypothetical protein